MTTLLEITDLCHGRPGFLAGSAVAAETYGLPDSSYNDIDIFLPTLQALVSMGEHLLNAGATLDERQERIWARWIRFGVNKWHTNSIKFDLNGTEINLIYKLSGGHPLTSLSMVIESFDFGFLGSGYELETGIKRDLRPYLFPGYDIDGPLPLMPNKEEAWRQGFISQYNGLRQPGRYAKHSIGGHDLSLVKPVLTTGYEKVGSYLVNHFDQDKQTLGEIFFLIGERIEADAFDQLLAASQKINYKDGLDSIMEALE